MSILKRYAKDTTKEPTEVLTTRVPQSIYNQFKKHCEQYGLSLAEATSILIKTELGDSYKEPSHGDVSKPIQKESPKQTSSLQNVSPKKQQHGKTERFNATEYAVDKELPCPICGFWFSQPNFARHAKRVHGLSKKEIFTENHEEAISMVKARTSQM
ncbi:hypothetical protein CN376_22895 [Bacillus cereus]|uniref:hypothetical protein n=1 Tax=Bacillus cereus TaxID=1396 RepID=UPI000BF3DF1A|nr:hypothetical protein [Bacillus cereus]PEZ87931.1 hypothetical protein CN376_22895 [Bacillus cereus]PFR12583.1 hypothetical protein COK30_13620 [Bacillus cereus]